MASAPQQKLIGEIIRNIDEKIQQIKTFAPRDMPENDFNPGNPASVDYMISSDRATFGRRAERVWRFTQDSNKAKKNLQNLRRSGGSKEKEIRDKLRHLEHQVDNELENCEGHRTSPLRIVRFINEN